MKPPAETSGYHSGIKHYRRVSDFRPPTTGGSSPVAFKGALGMLNSLTPTADLTKKVKRIFGVSLRKGQ